MFPQALVERYQQARQLYEQGKVDRALALLEDIERKAPNHPEIMHACALCYHALGRDEEALPLCNKLYTMHGDRRGLELRTQWKTQGSKSTRERFSEGPLEASGASDATSSSRYYLVAGLLILLVMTMLVFLFQARPGRVAPPAPKIPAASTALEPPAFLPAGKSLPESGASTSEPSQSLNPSETGLAGEGVYETERGEPAGDSGLQSERLPEDR